MPTRKKSDTKNAKFQLSECEITQVLIQNMPSCIAVYKPQKNGEEFVFIAFNEAAEKTEKISAEEVIGREVREVFPGVVDFGLFDVFREVYRTGKPVYHPISSYKDKRISGYRVNYVFKLPGGEIVAVYEDRTEQKLLEEKYKQGEERFRNLAEMLPEMICETDRTGRIVYANRLSREKFGYTEKDIEKGVFLESLVSKEDRASAQREILNQIRNRDNVSREYLAVTKTGRTFPAFFKINPIFVDNKINGLRGVMVDLTQQKEIQEKLERESSYLNQLIESAPEGIVQTYKDGTVIRINREFTHLFGYKENEINGMQIDEVLSGGDNKILNEAKKITEEIHEGRKVVIESVRYHKNGMAVPVSILGTPIFLRDRKIGVYGIYRDISKQKKSQLITEILLQISESALKAKNLNDFFKATSKHLSKILDTTNLFIALYDKKSDTFTFPFFRDEKDRFTRVPAQGTVSGYIVRTGKPQLLTGSDFKRLEQEGEISLVGTVSKVWIGVPLKQGKEIIGVISLQNYEDETAFTREDLKVLQIFSNQASLSIVHIQAQEDLRRAKEEAEENVRFKEQFLSTMSHEIRTPLNAIIGMSQLLMRTNPRKDQEGFLQALQISGESLLRLINDILDYSKLESGKMVTETIPFNPVNLAKSLQKVFSFRAEEKRLELKLDIDPKLPDLVKGDPTRITQILTNFVGNALKFTEKGSITIGTDLLSETKKYAEIRFYVKDTGIGIPPDKQDKIFESFTQAEAATTRKFGGTGLGLAISKRLVEMFHGHINVDSEPGKGSVFSFVLKLEKVDQKVPLEEQSLKPDNDSLKNKKVLIVEDNPLNRLLAEKFMKGWGMKVESVENGKEAVDKVRKNNYDIIVMDLQMPVMDGYEAAAHVRKMKDKNKSTIPIVALTASALLDVKSQVFQYGMNDVLMKPFQPETLMKILAENIRK